MLDLKKWSSFSFLHPTKNLDFYTFQKNSEKRVISDKIRGKTGSNFVFTWYIFRYKNRKNKWFKHKKMAAGIFIATSHSELLFEAKNSEFRCEIKFWKSLHFYSEKLRITSRVSSRLQPNWDNDSLNNLYFNIYQKIWIQEISMQIIGNKIELNMKSATIRKKASAKIFCMAGQIWHYYCCISKR